MEKELRLDRGPLPACFLHDFKKKKKGKGNKEKSFVREISPKTIHNLC